MRPVHCLLATLCIGLRATLAAGDIRVGPEFALPGEGPGRDFQGTPAAAFGNGAYLVAWSEGWHGKGGSARIRAARISTDGKLIDSAGIDIAPAGAGVQERPRLAFGGGVFLVVWQEFRSAGDCDIRGAIVNPDGGSRPAEAIVIAGGPRNQALPDVAGDGKGFVVVWQGLAGDETAYRGYAAPVSPDGKAGKAVETGIVPQPKVAWNGAGYLAAGGGAGFWRGSVYAARLDASGAPLGKPTEVIKGTKAAVFSLSGVPGRGWLVVSHRSPPDPWGWGGPGAMRAVLVNNEGRPENTDGIREPSGVRERLPGWLDMGREKTGTSTWPWGESASAFDGQRSVVVWQRYHLCGEKMTNFVNCDLLAARVDGYQSLDPAGVPVAAGAEEETRPAVASDGAGGLLVVYEKGESQGRSKVVARLLRTW